MGPMVLLTVPGRKSGEPRTTPVDLFERGGRRFLVSTHRQEESSYWVRNLRAAGEGVLTRGWSRRVITVVELPPGWSGAGAERGLSVDIRFDGGISTECPGPHSLAGIATAAPAC
jgi:deazaflavin-dependent oxidoreductase (nitroreductase family)